MVLTNNYPPIQPVCWLTLLPPILTEDEFPGADLASQPENETLLGEQKLVSQSRLTSSGMRVNPSVRKSLSNAKMWLMSRLPARTLLAWSTNKISKLPDSGLEILREKEFDHDGLVLR